MWVRVCVRVCSRKYCTKVRDCAGVYVCVCFSMFACCTRHPSAMLLQNDIDSSHRAYLCVCINIRLNQFIKCIYLYLCVRYVMWVINKILIWHSKKTTCCLPSTIHVHVFHGMKGWRRLKLTMIELISFFESMVYVCAMTWHDMTWHDMTWHDMTWHDMTWHDMTWQIM